MCCHFSHTTGSLACFLDSEYPDHLKIAQIIPIHKSGSKECCSNYRPISILPAITKVFEKLLYSRFYSYVETNELLSYYLQANMDFEKGHLPN